MRENLLLERLSKLNGALKTLLAQLHAFKPGQRPLQDSGMLNGDPQQATVTVHSAMG